MKRTSNTLNYVDGIPLLVYFLLVKTGEMIWRKFCVGPHMIPGMVYESSKLQKLFFILFYVEQREDAHR